MVILITFQLLDIARKDESVQLTFSLPRIDDLAYLFLHDPTLDHTLDLSLHVIVAKTHHRTQRRLGSLCVKI